MVQSKVEAQEWTGAREANERCEPTSDEGPGGGAPGTSSGVSGDVLALLNREVELYRRILELCEKERAVLLRGGGDALIDLLGELQVAVNTLNQVSRRRMSLAGRLGVDWNAGGALKAFAEMIQLSAEIAKVNRENERLIQGSLEYISFLDNYVGDGPELRRMIYAVGESGICDQHSLDWKR